MEVAGRRRNLAAARRFRNRSESRFDAGAGSRQPGGSAHRPAGPIAGQDAELRLPAADGCSRDAPSGCAFAQRRGSLRRGTVATARCLVATADRRVAQPASDDAAQAARRHRQAQGPSVLRLATVARDVALRLGAAFSVCAVSLSVRGDRLFVSAGGGGVGRRNGPGQDDASDHGDPDVDSCRRSAQRAARLPEAAGDQLAARIRPVGPRAAAHRDRG